MIKETYNKNRKYFWGFAILIVTALVFVMLNICIGSVKIPVQDVIATFMDKGADINKTNIIINFRLPRTLAAAILGGGLALSGYLLQTFFHNPIAGPFILGISSGAKLVVALTLVFLAGRVMYISSLTLVLASFVGAMISMGFVLLISKALNQMSMLIVGGVMIGYICSAITDFVVTFAEDSDIVNLHNWSRGSFSGISWDNVKVMALVIFITLFFVFLISKQISAYQMGEAYAQNVGLNVKLFRTMLVLLSSILSATVTAFAGPVSFVGIAVPHIVKTLFKTTKPILMIPGCFLGGASFCLLCDLIARVLFSPIEMSISSVTAVFGAPVVIYMMIRRRRERVE